MKTESHLERLASYLAVDPENVTLLADLADGHLRVGDWQQARSYLDRLLALRPRDPLSRYRLAFLERNSGAPLVAVTLLRNLLAEGLTEPAIGLELARALAQLGDWAGALEATIPIRPELLPMGDGDAVWLMRIRAHHRLAEFDAGRAEGVRWQQARGRLPIQGIAALASLELDAERLDRVAELLALCDPGEADENAELQCAAGFVALTEGDTKAASERFNRSVELRPDAGRSHMGVGLAAAVAGDPAVAISALHEATRLMPSHLGGWHALAWMQLLNDDLDGAAATFNQAEQRDHSFGETQGGLALVAALRGQRDEASERIRIAVRLDPKSMNAAIARLALQHNLRSIRDGNWLQQGLQQFSDFALKGNIGMQAMLAKVVAAASKQG